MAESTVPDPSDHALDLDTLETFVFERVLSENTLTGSMFLLGTLHDTPAILHVQRTLLPSDTMGEIVKSGLESFNVFLDNRPYFSAHALVKRTEGSAPDLQLKIIWPAQEDHIRKYSAQARRMFHETPELYQSVVVPYMDSFPASRLEWVFNILDGKKEAERILYRRSDPENGFIILPDLKWDETSLNALYLQAVVQKPGIRTLRDLTKDHVPMLKEIRRQAQRVAREKYGLEKERLRMFIHYQPSYYHFHVHIVNIDHDAAAGMLVGQAHLLDDIISLLELSPDAPGQTILARMTFGYILGMEHKLFPLLKQAVDESAEE